MGSSSTNPTSSASTGTPASKAMHATSSPSLTISE
ncbi:hypothetical protein LINPERHAP2_LOCUS34996 [Linum perenne]